MMAFSAGRFLEVGAVRITSSSYLLVFSETGLIHQADGLADVVHAVRERRALLFSEPFSHLRLQVTTP